MKKLTIGAAVLTSMLTLAQEKDTIKSNNIEEVVVNGRYYKKYVEKEGSSSLRLDEALIKIPQNISIITNKALEDQQVTTLSDGVLRNVAGAQRLEHWGDMYTRVNMRGSRAAAFMNGVNVTSNWGPLSEDMSYVDHIEFIKGPSGFLMSNGEPSGIYNIVTKKPTGKALNGTARVTLGSFNMYRGETDIDTKITDKVAFRLNMMAQNKKSFRDYEFNDRYIINPSLKVNLTDKTTVIAEYIYQKAKMSEVGSAYVYSFEGYGKKPVEYTVSDPGIDPTRITNHTVNLNLQHKFNDNWKLTTQLSYVNEYTMGSDIWPGKFISDTKFIRTLNFWEASNVMKFGQVFLNGYLKTGPVSHKILTGLDLGSKKYLADWSKSGPLDTEEKPFDLNAGTYTPPSAGYPKFDNQGKSLLERATPYGTIEQEYTGLYLQDELGFLDDALRLTVAARYTNVKENSYGTKTEANRITPRIGLSYSIDTNTSAYALYDQAFTPQSGLFRDGTTAKPITGNSMEIGFKRDWFNGKWNTTLSLYNINKNNAISGDPTDITGVFSILLGKTRVQGLEFDLKGEITKGFNAILNYAFTENKFTETTAKATKGDLVPGYAKHTINGWLNYTFTQGDLDGFGLSFGGTFLGGRSTWNWGSTNAPLQMNDYLKFDAGLSWENPQFRVGLNVFNVFNRYLYSGSSINFTMADANNTQRGGYYYQAEAPRNFRISLAYKF
ncbi:TonB-dependent siderophore receptor [Chryseobacterium indologenes]|uniref:TonB-dependent siderophore receptor n=1 Tax=Chryseobacterium indologenes TaxID=253 RepID=UPI000F4EF688|nr:TonB-dependent siderophore receptor [Chryseobacterium indologenes]AYZ37914.1 TonB-dependent siderophore receptor [Chryseobacterium indologenes]MBF6646830.1 TonB-dependent siderophore receptor [Chryseobacterium indologenes]MBU3048255.1 TonB-dependent siderophore receptor [Chryseobacterium indologenes]MEB4763006.1 TonB-dependent siderophore receptor [Chryseobacterium indologenes]QQQ69516.1 TonB-dependent siderophore receptor [Chryseobacterium indologenes]